MSAERPLEGQLAIVTGALGNLGPVWTEALVGAGARVVGIDLREAELAGGELEIADVTDRAALDAIADRHGPPAVLVNNAGIDQPPAAAARTARIEDVATDDFRTTLDVNLVGTFTATQAFGRLMAEAGSGSIVNIGSLYASIAPIPALYDHIEPPFTKPAAYGASKAAVVNLTRYFARLWGPHGVRVNALSPGGVRGGQDAGFVRKYSERVPLGRMAEPADLVGALLFLASEASAYVTGQELRVDGGFTA
jgi:NAD(P)-dependent dehydrogenase (short-subunit alcohol dehydrogenase family)